MFGQAHILALLALFLVNVQAENQWIIIGVLAQETHDGKHQVIASSYVKTVESSGARVVPIFVDRDDDYLHNIVHSVNGILMPGGGTPLIGTQYGATASKLLDLAIGLNQNGTYFPVWCTCLSFEKLITYTVGNNSWMSSCNASNVSLNLDFEASVLSNPKSTKMFKDDMMDIFSILKEKKVAANYHHVCLTESKFQELNLDKNFTLISTNTYKKVKFVSTIEHKKYPIYGSQWHPEKNQFEFVINKNTGNITHDRYAILVGQYFGNFLINEARKNDHRFKNKLNELDSLIYNYNHLKRYTGKSPTASFEEEYYFPNSSPKSHHVRVWFVLLFVFLFYLLHH